MEFRANELNIVIQNIQTNRQNLLKDNERQETLELRHISQSLMVVYHRLTDCDKVEQSIKSAAEAERLRGSVKSKKNDNHYRGSSFRALMYWNDFNLNEKQQKSTSYNLNWISWIRQNNPFE